MFGSRFSRWAAEKYHDSECHGLKITGCHVKGELSADAIDFISEALDLFESHDRHRFERFRKYFDFIMVGEGAMVTSVWKGRIFFVDVGRFDFATHREWSVCILAGYFVYHSTAEWIKERGVECDKSNLDDIRRMCFREQIRFLESLPVWKDRGWSLEYKSLYPGELSPITGLARLWSRVKGHSKTW